MNYNEAFIEAYGKSVATAPEKILKEFMARYDEDHDDLYEEFKEYYSSIMDAIGMWDAGIKFAQQQQNKNFLICLRQLQDMTDNNHAYDPLTNQSFNIAEQLAILEKAAS